MAGLGRLARHTTWAGPANAQRGAVFHEADVVDVGHFAAAHALVNPAHDVAQDALRVVDKGTMCKVGENNSKMKIASNLVGTNQITLNARQVALFGSKGDAYFLMRNHVNKRNCKRELFLRRLALSGPTRR